MTVLFSVEDSVATITLNRPDAYNAMNNEMAADLRDAIKSAARDAKVRAVLLTGTGKAFCSGQDLKSFTGGSLGMHLRQIWHPIIEGLATMEKPVVAAVNGVAAGAGASLALACDIRIASDKTTFMMAFTKVGVMPDSGSTWMLPRLIGLGRALELAYLADPVPAQRALELGLFNRVVPAADLASESASLAGRLAAGATKAFGFTKRAMSKSFDLTFGESLELEAQLQSAVGKTQDAAEGVAAFVEKRSPVFEGR